MADKSWKAFERRTAVFFGCVRNALSGRNSKHTASDTLHPYLFIECKLRAKHAHHETYSEAEKWAKEEGKIPVVVTQKKYANSFLIVIDKDYLLEFCRRFLESKGYKVIRVRTK